MNVLSVRNISKKFIAGGITVQALHNVSFDVELGSIVAIMGNSGSGKTTLLNILGGLEQMDAGYIFFNEEKEPVRFREPGLTRYRKDNIGIVFQKFNLLKDLNVRDNIAIPTMIVGLKEPEIGERVQKMAKLVGIENKLNSKPSRLSGGQQQRVAIARAMINIPKILLADEPTGNLDYNTSTDIMDVMLKMNKENGQTIIIVTHNPQIASLADKIIFLHNGEIKECYNKVRYKDETEKILDIMKTLGRIM